MHKNRNIFLYVAAIILVLVIIPITRKYLLKAVSTVSEPIASQISESAQKSSGFFSGIWEISRLKEDNSRLTAKLKNLQVDQSKLNELEHENEVLKNQLGFLEQHQEMDLVPARIIGKEPFGGLDKIIIDKGEDDWVKNGAAVVSNGSLVGKVTEVASKQAKITLVTSKDSIIQAMLQDSRTLGILKGSLEGVRLENIPQDTKVNDKEAIVTSGLGGEIASGILIGWARGDTSSKSEIYKTINLDLAEDLNKLEFVFIIK